MKHKSHRCSVAVLRNQNQPLADVLQSKCSQEIRNINPIRDGQKTDQPPSPLLTVFRL